MNNPGIVIVGSGMAGYTLARELRKRDAAVPVTLVTEGAGEAYSKPMLSNALAQGRTPDALVQKPAATMASELGMTVLAGQPVTGIDRANRRIVAGDAAISYDRLVLAVGARPRPWTAPGSAAAPVFAVNSLEDYRIWRDGLAEGARVLIVGAGLIGMEFANDLAQAGYAVTLVDPAPWPVARLAPEALGRAVQQALEDIGVGFRFGRNVAEMQPEGTGWRARLDDGATVEFDRALVAIGLVPRAELAADAGLAADGGIVVDTLLRTADPDIFALGDCARGPAGALPFVLPLMAQARALAATLTGSPTPLHLPALPVLMKTPALPLVVCPPPAGVAGTWAVSGSGRDLRALYRAADGSAIGFALSGTETAARQTLAKTMPDMLAS